jgi:hypothetical protein
LGLSGVVIDENTQAPVALGHVRWRITDEYERCPRDIHAFDITRIDLEGESKPAIVVASRPMTKV